MAYSIFCDFFYDKLYYLKNCHCRTLTYGQIRNSNVHPKYGTKKCDDIMPEKNFRF